MAKNAYVTVDENASSPLPRDRRGDMISGVTHYELDPATSLHYFGKVRNNQRGTIMLSTITSKYQTTIPKAVRKKLGLSVKDALEWKMEDGRVVVAPAKARFLRFKNSVRVGPGSIAEDIDAARDQRLQKFQ
jgi:AbrB family looped-hinge helix DNA binding protein